MVSERSELDTFSIDDKKKEMRKVYRKLKGVRCKISVKLRELEKEAKEERFSGDDQELDLTEEKSAEEKALDQELTHKNEKIEMGKISEVQYEVRTLLGAKARLRRKFQKLREDLGKNIQTSASENRFLS